jgi:hypothetical protein
MYEIQPYSYKMAELLGYNIKPSKNPKKKIDVYSNGNFLFSIGQYGAGDFPTFAKYDLEYALKRRRAYHLRHHKDNVIGTRGFASLHILW